MRIYLKIFHLKSHNFVAVGKGENMNAFGESIIFNSPYIFVSPESVTKNIVIDTTMFDEEETKWGITWTNHSPLTTVQGQ